MNRFFTFSLICLGMHTQSKATEMHMTLRDLVSNAHVVVTATCMEVRSVEDPARPRIVGSVASFDQVRVIRSNKAGTAPAGDRLELHYLGGSANGVNMFTCGTPRFAPGERYLLFLLNDGQRYISPVVGGPQGLFSVITDDVTGDAYVLTAADHGITESTEEGLIVTALPIRSIQNGEPRYAEPPADRVAHEIDRTPEAPSAGARILPLEAFIDLINAVEFDRPSLNAFLSNGQPMPRIPDDTTPSHPEAENGEGDGRTVLGACMHQDVYLWFEQNDAVPGYGSAWATIEDYGKAIFDVHMNIYSDDANPTDGFGAGNGECEIAGWMTSGQLNNYYGYNWGGSLAMCVGWSSNWNGGEITETDIIMNASYSWTTDWNTAFQGSAINYRNCIVHELGHSWGYQAGNCYEETYDYSYPSVMHAYYANIREDGKEIHARDAQIIRSLYDNQTSIKDVDDLGVESYRALDGTGLVDGYASDYYLPAGQNVTINRVTVENCSDDPQTGVRVRFYLSPNTSLSSGDHLCGNYNLGTMNPVTRIIDSYVLNTADVPPGTYYIGMQVTRGGTAYSSDDRPANNVAWSTYTIQITGGVGIAETTGPLDLHLFPNPAHDEVTVTLPDGFGPSNIVLYNSTGQRSAANSTSTSSTAHRSTISLHGIAAGLYVVEVTTDSGERAVGRLVVR